MGSLTWRNLYFLIFTAAGFSGLVYEAIWSHYLRLFLGHAAYAQVLVLAIFMGGMAIGSWICSRYSTRWKDLLLGFALAEGIIGLLALIFHGVFVSLTDFAYLTVIPALGSPATVQIFKWGLSSLLVLPQSILLGMTFPLMSAGLIRWFPSSPGSTLAMLYFTNSMGAAVGVLVGGFVLIDWVGLPGTIRAAGWINVGLAAMVWLLAGTRPPPAVPSAAATRESGRREGFWYAFLLAASLVTGAASFIYEIGWIRMLSLVLGSSTHAFELMLSAFILGLALGGLWIRGRMDRLKSPLRTLARVQIVMGLLALATLPSYGNAFAIMKGTLNALTKTDAGYSLFNISSHLIALMIMLPATFCAGMTLPLITYALIQRGHGEKSIGAVYASNTLGAIAGVLFAIHLGMPLLGLKGLIALGAGLDIGLGLALAWRAYGPENRYAAAPAAAISLLAMASILIFVRLDPYKMASGVYRTGFFLTAQNSSILFHRDGKTASVDLVGFANGYVHIRTNGKTDAAINMGAAGTAAPDESTMVLAAAVPLALHPGARTAANIGLGSGLTTHALLTVPWLERVDTIEIEPAMVEAAKGFRPRVDLAYSDPRSRIHIDDAKTFFSTHNRKYDIIISEPSNPWVSGVSGLFSEEFYRLIRRHLNEKGLLVQWFQLYEVDMELVSSVLKALSSYFDDYVIYAPDDGNILIVATNGNALAGPDPRVLKSPGLADELRRIGIRNLQDFDLRRLGKKKTFDPLWKTYAIRPNSDYYPVLDLKAPRTRFMNVDARAFIQLASEPIPALDILERRVRPWVETRISENQVFGRTLLVRRAMGIRDIYENRKSEVIDSAVPPEMRRHAELVRLMFRECNPGIGFSWDSWMEIANATISYLTPRELEALWERAGLSNCRGRLPEARRAWLELQRAIALRDVGRMGPLAVKVLEEDRRPDQKDLEYLVSVGLLGYLANGDPSGAQRLWSRYGAHVMWAQESHLLLKLIAAHRRRALRQSVLRMKEDRSLPWRAGVSIHATGSRSFGNDIPAVFDRLDGLPRSSSNYESRPEQMQAQPSSDR